MFLHGIIGDRIMNFGLSGVCGLYDVSRKYKIFLLYQVVNESIILKSPVNK
jgi:hypothetical protein